jgi:two-component system chemotaxis response regulator CheB
VIKAEGLARDVVTIGGSAGSIEGLIRLFAKLPPDFPAAIAVVVHRSPFFESQLDRVFGRHSSLPVAEPRDGDPLEHGRIYLAPRDHHMVVEAGRFRLKRGPHQHRFRPAVDALFLSAARDCGPRVIGLLLSGGGADGVRGLIAIKAAGGISLVQDPGEARCPSMPLHAIAEDDVDAVLHLDRIPEALVTLAEGGALECDAIGRDSRG